MNISALKYFSCAILLVIGATNAQASVEIGASRVVFNESTNEALLKLKNPQKDRPYLVQSWLEPYKYGDNKIANPMPKIPFVITPPLFRIESGDENFLRIIKNKATLPTDRESVFTLNVKAIPETEKTNKNTLAFAIKTSIKMIFRPVALEGANAETAYQNINFHIKNNKLIANNPTGYVITISNLKINNDKVEIQGNTLLEPFANVAYTLPTANNGKVSWQSIGDLGQLTEVHMASLN
jgi:fimbrial chaperone protein